MNRKEILRNKYVPQHSGDYFSKHWYKRDLMHYFDYVDYQEMCKRPTNYFKDKENIKFDIIHHESRGYPLLGSYKNYSDDYFSKPWYKRDLITISIMSIIKKYVSTQRIILKIKKI